MNAAATQDLRATDVWPAIRALLRTGNAPSARAEAAAGLVDSWRGMGASRIDGDLDGKVDHPGAAVMDDMAADRGCRHDTSSRPPRRQARPAHDSKQRSEPGRLGLPLGLVRLPRQGSASARPTRARPVLAPLLRCRRARDLPGSSGARWTPPLESWRTQALRHRPGARTRPASAFASPPASCRTRCAGRTARPSSRSFRSRVTDRADPWGLASGRPASRGHTARLTAMTRKRYLMAPGPTPVPPGCSQPAPGIDPSPWPGLRWSRMLGRLQEVCRTRNDVLVFTASGSGRFESPRS